jgi:hypothetical protein
MKSTVHRFDAGLQCAGEVLVGCKRGGRRCDCQNVTKSTLTVRQSGAVKPVHSNPLS